MCGLRTNRQYVDYNIAFTCSIESNPQIAIKLRHVKKVVNLVCHTQPTIGVCLSHMDRGHPHGLSVAASQNKDKGWNMWSRPSITVSEIGWDVPIHAVEVGGGMLHSLDLFHSVAFILLLLLKFKKISSLIVCCGIFFEEKHC